ncbi:MAG: bifunctional UDP-N-acetylglucosamine diphosphorylase/glucosamine-1-phosphate N-acetyltransferase GlmU [Solirubrobacteraceae bacterium]
MSAPTVVILAAGQGTRMRSATPKVLHELCGRPMILWPVAAALEAGASRVIVVGGPDGALDGRLPDGVRLAVQSEAKGTGDAVLAAAELIEPGATVIVLAGDVPLITAAFISELHAAHRGAATIATMMLEDPAGYGRVVRDADGGVERVVETKRPGEATVAELAIHEVNTGIFAFDGAKLIDALGRVTPDNFQGEYYLPDALGVLRAGGEHVGAHAVDDAALLLGVNDRIGLGLVREEAQRRIHEHHMRAGVTIVQPASTSIDAAVSIEPDARIEPCSQLLGSSHFGAGAVVGPHSTLLDAKVGRDCRVLRSHLERCELHPGASVGPFAYLRPDALLRERAKAGAFVEIKNSDIGAGAKVPHLSYIGDADVGEAANLGAGSITANYDGTKKHRTKIGARVRGGVNTAYVAPVEVGDDAVTAAGSTVTEDVPAKALAIARERQRNIEGFSDRSSS